LAVINNYLLTKSEVFTGNLKPRPCHIDRAIARSTWQGRGKTVKTERSRLISCLLHGFLLCFCWPVIGPRALRENNTLASANQSANLVPGAFPFKIGRGGKKPWERGCQSGAYIGCKRKSYIKNAQSLSQ